MRCRIARLLTAAAILACCTPAEAQQNRAGCLVPDAPFELTPANRVNGTQLRALLSGKRVVAQRRNNSSPSSRYGFEFRADGSLVFTCQVLNGEPCGFFTPGGSGRDIGVWRIEGDQLVLQRTRFAAQGRIDGRVTLHRQGNVYAGGRTSAPHFCLAGPLVVE